MNFALHIEYIYAKDTSNTRAGKSRTKHIISNKIIKQFLSDKAQGAPEIILSHNDISVLLLLDGAIFDSRRIRYFSYEHKGFMKIDEDFQMPIVSNSKENPPKLILWITKQQHHQERIQFSKLSARIARLEKEFQRAKNYLASTEQKNITMKLIPEQSLQSLQEIGSHSKSYLEAADSENAINRAKELTQTRSISLNENYSRLQKTGSSSAENNPHPFLLNLKKLDIAIMYAEPLVQIVDSRTTITLPDAVDYEEECREIYENLQAKGIKLNLMIEIATRTNFVNVLTKNPVILHIMCHGEYDKAQNRFYICFEKSNGELDKLYAEDIKEILDKLQTKVQLVFVNACHSEPIASVFAEAGVPCVIGVQSQLQIADYFARKFAQGFYNFIFDGIAVGEAFNLSLVSAADSDSYSCCCAHSHKSDCKWFQKAKQEGYSHAHLHHEPLCTSCPRKNENIHKLSCEWAQDFQAIFCPDADIDFLSETTMTCCCSAELPHNELLKFTMISKEKKKCESMVLFENLEQGKIQNCKIYSVIDQRFPAKPLIGRNKQLHDLFTLAKGPAKVIKLEGSKGIGKTALTRQLANYLYSRNHFRFKISDIDLSTISTVSGLMSKIFSEIGLVNDITTFCETVRSKEVLYILDNCDSFLEHNRVEFSKSLRSILTCTKNVKFLVIITKLFDLDLQEASYKLGPLLPIHAAKLLLLSTPIDKIYPMKYRNVDVLKQSALFKQAGSKISIQTLFWVSQRLIQGCEFDTIQEDLLSTLQTGTIEEQSMILTETTLKQIQLENVEGYKLIRMINTFEGGVNYLDLQEMADHGLISNEWAEIILNLILTQTTPKQNEELKESSLHSKDENRAKKLTKFVSALKPGNYFWFKIVMAKEDLPIFESAESVRDFLYQKIDLDLLSLEFKKIEYLATLSLSLLQKLKRTNIYNEKIIENSAVSYYGIWKYSSKNTIYNDFINQVSKIEYLDDEKSYNNSKDLEIVFNPHKKNAGNVFNLSFFKEFLTNQESREKAIDIIEILFFTIPTIFKIISGGSDSVLTLTSEALNCLNELDIKEERITVLKIKLHLLIMALTISQRNETMRIEQIINSEIQLLELNKRDIKDDQLLQRIDFELALTRAKFFYRLQKGRYKSPDVLPEEPSPQLSFNFLSFLENQCPKMLKNLNSETEVEQAKLTLLIYDAYSERAENLWDQEKAHENLTEAIRVFRKYYCKKLELKTHLLMAKLYLRSYIEKKNAGNSTQILMKESTVLGQLRKYNLKQDALLLAYQIGDAKSSTKVNLLINAFNVELRQSLFNMFVFLHSEPTVLNPEDNHLPQFIQKDYNPQITIPLFFKSELLDVLSKREKILNIKFEILTKQSLEEALNSGCRILYLGIEIASEEGIIAEDSRSKPVFIPREELKQLFAESKAKRESLFLDNLTATEHKIEVLILDSRNSPKLAKYFAEELQIPHVIFFEFETAKKLDYKRRLYEKVYCSKFTQFFLNELVSGKSVKKSYDNAVRDTLGCLSYSFFDLAEEKEVMQYLGKGAVLIPEDLSIENELHNKNLFGTGEFILQSGKIEDLSLQRFFTNVHKSSVPFIGRAKEMSQIVEFLMNDPEKMNGFLKITGEEGVGKTRLVLEVGWYLVQRHMFPHGIFYIPLRKLKKMNIYELIEKTSQKIGFGSDKNYANFFRNKKMLLILDDFDILYSGEIEIPSLVLTMIKRYKTPVIAVTTKFEPKETSDHAIQSFQKQFLEIQSRIESEFVAKSITLKRLEPNHIANIILSLTSTSFKGELSYDDALMNPLLLRAKGLPGRVVQLINENKLIHKGVHLNMFSYYLPFQDLNKRYRHYFKTGRDFPETERKIFALSISRHSRYFKEEAEKMMSNVSTETTGRVSQSMSPHYRSLRKSSDLQVSGDNSQYPAPHKKGSFSLNPEIPNTNQLKRMNTDIESEIVSRKDVISHTERVKSRKSVTVKLQNREGESETESN